MEQLNRKSLSQTLLIAAVIIPVIFSMAFLSACATGSSSQRGGKSPLWLTDKDAVYPVDEFLAETGEGDGLSDAKAAAAGAIAQIFRTRITVDSTIRTRYTEMTGEGGQLLGMLSRTDIDESIGQSSDESLVNLRYGESWTSDMGRVYTIAYLDRAETGRLYRRRIMENDSRIVELRQRADSQDDPLRRFAFLDAALVSAEINRVLVEQLEIINMPMAASIIHDYNLGELREERADQARALRIRVEVFGDPEGRIGAVLSDWVTSRGFTVADNGDMFLSAMTGITPVTLNNDYENLAWELNLSLMDFLGQPAVTLPGSGRSSGVSKTAAEERAYFDMSEKVSKDFDRAFNAYLDSFLDK